MITHGSLELAVNIVSTRENRDVPAPQAFDQPFAHTPCRFDGNTPGALLAKRYRPRLNDNHSRYGSPTSIWYLALSMSVGTSSFGVCPKERENDPLRRALYDDI